MDTESFIYIMDFVGTAAFAVSGALTGIRKKMDIFGVNILAIVTATGGGIIRDLIIGSTPPKAFVNPIFVLVSAITANIVFLFMWYINKKGTVIPGKAKSIYDKVFFWCDSVGLAAFTADGVHAGLAPDMMNKVFLVIFLGVVTGVGGGVFRDILSLEMPVIFVKHIYACASILGAIVTYSWYAVTGSGPSSLLAGFFVTVVIRYLAASFGWNLPKIKA